MKIYLAGPEVFLPNAREILDEKISLTRVHGFTPVAPGDLTVAPSLSGREKGLAISAHNEALMLSADVIIANLTPYRGLSADVGTVYELGFMCARGCPAYAFTNVTDGLFERTSAWYGGDVREDAQGQQRGTDGLMLENCGFVDNLMLDGGIESRNGAVIRHEASRERLYTDLTAFQACLAIAARQLLS
ncbi:nucleoside 2-deoxyribosyltransferase [Devosia sp. YIM 151766]|uniref:nucleoside 2-deoxyribosyltransferase n=1 Tax=Devosia sp. YIM 151766 TaxID=3017325 RepID=UPI00255C4E3D|nr:nucleoside 2-deoxyribosyltransferase [Devosia sp. YIM 151766]WIY53283.1 nucleoside 2-deoxyribosyltransferase [Devosia sp. YIM 151766]